MAVELVARVNVADMDLEDRPGKHLQGIEHWDRTEAQPCRIDEDGVTLVVDPISLDLVRGSTVDFVESLGGAAFQVTNPNAASGCGCGTSFSV